MQTEGVFVLLVEQMRRDGGTRVERNGVDGRIVSGASLALEILHVGIRSIPNLRINEKFSDVNGSHS